MNWRKIKCYDVKDMDIIGVQRERGKPAMVLMADKGHYRGGAFVTFKPTNDRLYGTGCRARLGGRCERGIRRTRPNG